MKVGNKYRVLKAKARVLRDVGYSSEMIRESIRNRTHNSILTGFSGLAALASLLTPFVLDAPNLELPYALGVGGSFITYFFYSASKGFSYDMWLQDCQMVSLINQEVISGRIFGSRLHSFDGIDSV